MCLCQGARRSARAIDRLCCSKAEGQVNKPSMSQNKLDTSSNLPEEQNVFSANCFMSHILKEGLLTITLCCRHQCNSRASLSVSRSRLRAFLKGRVSPTFPHRHRSLLNSATAGECRFWQRSVLVL